MSALPTAPASLSGAVVLVTGASSGIGEAASRLLAAEGAHLVLGARRQDRLDSLATELRERHHTEVLCLELDVTRESSVAEGIAQIRTRFGRLTHAFNNAGVGATHKPIHEITEAEYDQVMDTCLKGVFLCLKHQLPLIADSGGGSVVNTTSVGGLVGVAGSSDYVAAKHGVIGMTKSAAMEFAGRGVRVNAIAPGPVMTEMYQRWLPTHEEQQRVAQWTLLKRIASPEEIARYALFLMSQALYTTGSVVVCDGGISVG